MFGSPRFSRPQTVSSGFRHRVASLLGLTFIVACGGSGGGSGCGAGGMGQIKGGFPVDKRVENAISLRVTKPAFDFLEQNAKPVVDKLLPPGGIPVPSGCTGDTQICCGQTCKVLFDFQNLKFDPTPPKTLKLTLRAKLKTSEDFNIKAKVVITANCKLALDTTKSGKGDIGITMAVNATSDATTKLTSLAFDPSSVDILDLDSGDITIKGDLICDTINLLKGFFINTLKDQLKKQLATPLDTLFCQSCNTADDCSSLANQGCSASKQCTRNGACLQQLGFEGQIDLSALTGKPAGTGAGLEFYAVAGGYSAVEAAPALGLSLGMLGGGVTSQKSTCAPTRPAPTGPVPTKTAQYSGNTTPKGDPYHVGAGISKLELDTLGHAFYESGALCLAIGTEQVDALSSGLLSALVPSLNDLTRGQNSAVQMVIRPQQPPTFTLGKGTFKVDGMGKRVIDDPLLHLRIKDLAIDFYVFIDERYVRFMRQTADIDLPLSLDIDGMNQILPMIGELDSAFGNVRVTDSSLLKESPAMLARLFPSLLPALSGSLGSALKPIQLPSFSGLSLLPVQITSTPDAMGVLSFLGLYLKLAIPPAPIVGEEPLWSGPVEASAPVALAPRTRLELVSVEVPTQAEMAVTAAEPKNPRVTLALSADNPEGGRVEWQYRLDGGLWHPFDEQRQLVLSEAGLRLPGTHVVEVRSRIADTPVTTERTPARVEFVIVPSALAAGSGTAAAAAPVVKNSDGSIDHVASGCSQSGGRAGAPGTLLVLGLGLLGLLGRRRGTLRKLVRLSPMLGGLVMLGGGCKDDVPVVDNPQLTVDMAEPGVSGKPKPEFSATDEIGRYQSAVVSGGKLYIAAYDSTFGDLAFTTITDPQQKPVWYPVDGLPSGDPENTDGKATRGGYVEPGDDVGRFTSLAFTSQGNPVVAYQDVTNNAVKLAMRDGDKWTVSAISDSKEGAGQGFYTQLILTGDVPTVAYMIAGVVNGMGVANAQLVVATAKSAKPSGPGDWTKRVVEQIGVPCAGLCATGQACVYVDPVKKDKNATVCKTLDKTCSPSCKSNQACQAAKCVDALGAPAVGLGQGTGLFARLVSDKSGPQLLFYNRVAGALRLASGADWKVVTVAGGDSKSDLGRYIGAALGDDGTLHVAYSSADGRLYYQSLKAGVPKPAEVVDDGMRTVAMTAEMHSVGAGAVLYLDGGKPVIAYQDSTSSTLEVARRDAAWTHKTVAGGMNTSRGFYPQAAQLGGAWWVLDVAYDRAGDAFTSVRFTKP